MAEQGVSRPIPSPGVVNRHVVEVDPQADPRWEAFVAAHPDGLIYHHSAWGQVLERTYGFKPVWLACEDGRGQLVGILPLCYTRGLLTGRMLSSLPRTPVAGPLALDDQATIALVRAAVERVCREPGTRLQIKGSWAGLEGLVEGIHSVPWDWDVTYQIELPEEPRELRFGNSRNHTAIKRAVNKAAKLGVQVRPAETVDELRDWYELYLDTMRWHVVPPRPYHFFEAAWELLQPHGLMRLLLAEQYEAGRSRLLAGSIYLMFGQAVVYAFNGRRQEDLPSRPNDAIHWQAIQDACRDGFRRYDLGGVLGNQHGLAKYKRKWGAEPKRLYCYYYPCPEKLEIGVYRLGSNTGRLARAVWRRLPLKATALLGDRLYRYM